MEPNLTRLTTASPPDAYDDVRLQLVCDSIASRIWRHDHTVWSSDPAEITNRLGWLHAPEDMTGHLHRIARFVAGAHEDGFRAVVLLGMGGSSLAPEVYATVFACEDGIPLTVLDSTDPSAVIACERRLDLAATLFIVATKSGGTVETLSLFKYFYNRVEALVGAHRAGAHFVAITDPLSSLGELAERFGFRETFENDPDIGGRFAALSFFGLVPAALVGVDVGRLLERACAEAAATAATGDPASTRIEAKSTTGDAASATGDPASTTGDAADSADRALRLGAFLGASAAAGRDKATFILSSAIAPFGDWVEQLIAESTGKSGQGILPVVGEPVGRPEAYGDDRVFVQLRLDGDDTRDEAVSALARAGHPVAVVRLADRYDLGGQFFLWMMATAVAGHVMGIQPFDQPDVEAAKVLARDMVGAYRRSGRLPPGDTIAPSQDALTRFLAAARTGDYVAVQAFVQPTARTDEALLRLRTALRDRYRLATTVGYGPRFLHSTGQLHKGDGGNGMFVQLVSQELEDVPIPDEAGAETSSMTFGVLEQAQALGDAQALLQAGRRVIRFDLGTDVVSGIDEITARPVNR